MLVLASSGNVLYPQQSSPPRLAMSSPERPLLHLRHFIPPNPIISFSYATTRKHHHG